MKPLRQVSHNKRYVYYSNWGSLVQTPEIPSGFKDKNSRALVVSWVFCFTQVLQKQACFLFSLNVRQSLAWRSFSPARSSLRHLRRFSSFFVLQPTLPVTTTHRMLTTTCGSGGWCFLLSLYSFSFARFSGQALLVFQLGSRFCVISFSFRVCATSLVFASVYKFTVFASALLFYFPVCVTTSVLASVCKFSFRICEQLQFSV